MVAFSIGRPLVAVHDTSTLAHRCRRGRPPHRLHFAHLRSASNAGKGLKPHDAFGVSLCRTHHIEQHCLGEETFGRRYGLDLWALAAEFVRRSPDFAMRASLVSVI